MTATQSDLIAIASFVAAMAIQGAAGYCVVTTCGSGGSLVSRH
jgi:hypothetical protein